MILDISHHGTEESDTPETRTLYVSAPFTETTDERRAATHAEADRGRALVAFLQDAYADEAAIRSVLSS